MKFDVLKRYFHARLRQGYPNFEEGTRPIPATSPVANKPYLKRGKRPAE
jgi:hypothetical protein